MSDDDFLNGDDFAELEADDFGASDFLDGIPEYLASEDDYDDPYAGLGDDSPYEDYDRDYFTPTFKNPADLPDIKASESAFWENMNDEQFALFDGFQSDQRKAQLSETVKGWADKLDDEESTFLSGIRFTPSLSSQNDSEPVAELSAYYVPERQLNQYGREYRPENQLLHDSKPENLNKTLMVAEARERMTQRNGESSNA